MAESATHPLEKILRLCAEAAPEPWYPSAYAQAAGTPRDALDPDLDRLRLGGLIRLTDWVQGRGQGYMLTPEGERVLRMPRELARVRAGTYQPQPAAEFAAADEDSPWNHGEAVRAALLAPTRPVVTYVLIVLNLLWFAAGLGLALYRRIPPGDYLTGFSQRLDYLLLLRDLGGLLSADVTERGQWWRLMTTCFVHGGLLHLGMNLYGLLILGLHLEQMWGRVRFLVIYALAGLGGSCVSVLWQRHGLLVGASGAIWGLMASEVVWLVLNRGHLPGPLVSDWLRQLRNVFLLNILITVAPMFSRDLPQISATAHFGGGAVGAFAAILLHYQRFGRRWQRLPALLGVLLVPAVCLAPVVREAVLVRQMKEISKEEHRQLGVPGEPAGPFFAQVLMTEQTAWKVYADRALPLLKEAPKERDGHAVAEALTGLLRAQSELDRAADTLRHNIVASTEASEQIRKTLERLCREEAKLFGEAARCLRQGGDITDDAYDQQRLEVIAVQETWCSLKRKLAR